MCCQEIPNIWSQSGHTDPLSTFQTCIQFNEWSKRRHTLHRFLLILPFFATTIIYRDRHYKTLLASNDTDLCYFEICTLANKKIVNANYSLERSLLDISFTEIWVDQNACLDCWPKTINQVSLYELILKCTHTHSLIRTPFDETMKDSI